MTLTAADGTDIAALRYSAEGLRRGRIVVAGATGVPQRFYGRFAQFARTHGYETLTLDYRGISLSAPPTLKGYHVDYLDWARLDLAANALDGWAPPRSRDAFMRAYSSADLQGVDIDPRRSGLGPIGHMGYFRPHARPLWEGMLEWFDAPTPGPIRFPAPVAAAA